MTEEDESESSSCCCKADCSCCLKIYSLLMRYESRSISIDILLKEASDYLFMTVEFDNILILIFNLSRQQQHLFAGLGGAG